MKRLWKRAYGTWREVKSAAGISAPALRVARLEADDLNQYYGVHLNDYHVVNVACALVRVTGCSPRESHVLVYGQIGGAQ
jgi:hypothetical protein